MEITLYLYLKSSVKTWVDGSYELLKVKTNGTTSEKYKGLI